MFGYVRPYKPELRCKDYDLYSATYCGLCRTLGRRCGVSAPLTLNYEFTFLALLLHEPEQSFSPCRGRCPGNPLRRLEMSPENPATDLAADKSVILSYWKLRDTAQDEAGYKGLSARALAAGFSGVYRRAADRQPDYANKTRACLEELAQLEAERCPSIDRTADTFARLVAAAADRSGDDARDRALEQLLYHLGRWIYLIDARDDFQEDFSAGRYNPLMLRYGPEGDDDALRLTLEQSLGMMRAAFELCDFGVRGPVIENILYLGLPLVQRAVFDGSWATIEKQKIWRKDA